LSGDGTLDMKDSGDFHQLLKLTEPTLALEQNLRFGSSEAESVGKNILKLRSQITRLAEDLNRSLSVEGKLQIYLQDLMGYQELIRQFGPIQPINDVLKIVLQLSKEVMHHDGATIYLWGESPVQWAKKKAFHIQKNIQADIETELKRKSILDGSEREPFVIPFISNHEEGCLIVIPLVSAKRQFGVFIAYKAISHLTFFGHNINIFSMFGQAVSIAVENSFLFEKVQNLSIKDDLSELYNSRYLHLCLSRNIKKATSDKPLAVFFMDLDNFKSVNDSHGHLVGSQVLREAAQLVQRFTGKKGYAARYGGDEFVVVMPDCSLSQAGDFAEQLRFKIEINDFLKGSGQIVNLTISIGYALFPLQAENEKDLLYGADMAMYAAKSKGKNQVCRWLSE